VELDEPVPVELDEPVPVELDDGGRANRSMAYS
jgi:hypothetical protein